MSTSQKKTTNPEALPTELKAEQALGLIGIGLMQKMSKDGLEKWDWSNEDNGEKANLITLRQRLELTALAIETGAPLSTAEVTHLLGAKPGAPEIDRGGLTAKRISRNVWRLSKKGQSSNHWRN